MNGLLKVVLLFLSKTCDLPLISVDFRPCSVLSKLNEYSLELAYLYMSFFFRRHEGTILETFGLRHQIQLSHDIHQIASGCFQYCFRNNLKFQFQQSCVILVVVVVVVVVVFNPSPAVVCWNLILGFHLCNSSNYITPLVKDLSLSLSIYQMVLDGPNAHAKAFAKGPLEKVSLKRNVLK